MTPSPVGTSGEPPLTVEEFLRWHDDKRRRWELVDGYVREMVLPSSVHSELTANLAYLLGAQLPAPFRCGTVAALILPDRDDVVYLADIVVTRAPRLRGERLFPDPILIVEILAPASEAYDRKTKLPDYMTLSSTREILFVSSTSMDVDVWQATESDWRHETLSGADEVITLDSVPAHFSLAQLYNGIKF